MVEGKCSCHFTVLLSCRADFFEPTFISTTNNLRTLVMHAAGKESGKPGSPENIEKILRI